MGEHQTRVRLARLSLNGLSIGDGLGTMLSLHPDSNRNSTAICSCLTNQIDDRDSKSAELRDSCPRRCRAAWMWRSGTLTGYGPTLSLACTTASSELRRGTLDDGLRLRRHRHQLCHRGFSRQLRGWQQRYPGRLAAFPRTSERLNHSSQNF